MNYIKHLNKAMQLFYEDQRLLPTHIALYFALFQVWNQNRFQNPLSINRVEIMKAAKVNSLSTYTKCLRQLQEWEYLEYHPSFNPAIGSKVHLFNLCTGSCTGKGISSVQVNVQLPYINNINKNKGCKENISPSLNEVFIFFKDEGYPQQEANKFYNHYESNGWKVGGKSAMVDWKAAACKWMLNTNLFKTDERNKTINSRQHQTGKNKNYSEPL